MYVYMQTESTITLKKGEHQTTPDKNGNSIG